MTSNASVRRQREAARADFLSAERAATAGPLDPTGRVDASTTWGRRGQCRNCGAWRADGTPPTVHRTNCGLGPAGSELPAVSDPSVLAKHRKAPR